MPPCSWLWTGAWTRNCCRPRAPRRRQRPRLTAEESGPLFPPGGEMTFCPFEKSCQHDPEQGDDGNPCEHGSGLKRVGVRGDEMPEAGQRGVELGDDHA